MACRVDRETDLSALAFESDSELGPQNKWRWFRLFHFCCLYVRAAVVSFFFGRRVSLRPRVFIFTGPW